MSQTVPPEDEEAGLIEATPTDTDDPLLPPGM